MGKTRYSTTMSRGLIYAISLLGSVFAQNASVICNGNNTITVTVQHTKQLELVALSYGTCNENSAGIRYTQDANHKIEITLQVTPCGMDSNLRTSEYSHNMIFKLGHNDDGMTLFYSEYTADVSCSYITEYDIRFSYGLEMPVDNMTSFTGDSDDDLETTAGIVNEIQFNVKAYTNGTYLEATSTPNNKAGQTIYLGITASHGNVSNFNMSSLDLSYAPIQCDVVDVSDDSNALQLYHYEQNNCENVVIDLKVGYIEALDMITIEHTLFLINHKQSSSFDLMCSVRVCDTSIMANACDSMK